jgi:HAE1 family hydrophobic/amphiphilic exporter-1
MRRSLGTAVFAGMLGVTGFVLIFRPAFYTARLRGKPHSSIQINWPAEKTAGRRRRR